MGAVGLQGVPLSVLDLSAAAGDALSLLPKHSLPLLASCCGRRAFPVARRAPHCRRDPELLVGELLRLHGIGRECLKVASETAPHTPSMGLPTARGSWAGCTRLALQGLGRLRCLSLVRWSPSSLEAPLLPLEGEIRFLRLSPQTPFFFF